MNNKKEPLTPKFADDSCWSLYEYSYCSNNYDKIYYSMGDNELRKDMLNHSSTIKANHKLAGEIQKEVEIKDKELILKLEQMMCKHLSLYTGQSISKVSVVNPDGGMSFWINYMRPTEYNPNHDHSGLFSFVWYLDIPEEIREEWKDSESNVGTVGCIEFFSQLVANHKMMFNPRTNDLLIFSSKHLHTVYPYYSPNTRISLAGNIYEMEVSNEK